VSQGSRPPSARRQVEDLVNRALGDRAPLRVLDAGCGGTTRLSFSMPAWIAGIDSSARQLERHSNLDEKIVGDVQSHRFAPASFDVVIAWQLLEHLPKPEEALLRFTEALDDGGRLIIGVPNVLSLKGLVTKFTPHGFHVLVYRRLTGNEGVGTGDTAPFRTFLRFSLRRSAIERFARENGFLVEYFRSVEWEVQRRLRERAHLTGSVWSVIKFAVRLATAGQVDAEQTDFVIVLRKAPNLFRGTRALENDESPSRTFADAPDRDRLACDDRCRDVGGQVARQAVVA
jgi:SAM-dependent methyltransferase